MNVSTIHETNNLFVFVKHCILFKESYLYSYNMYVHICYCIKTNNNKQYILYKYKINIIYKYMLD